ncbi:MBL fold metallo-hydrolase [Kaistia sp. MMO-174]|uniref:MBL fold metallo-hydrolase n=1 Tax=Kaistia sp. MMO-174 TaxID=3081256 RepID=UPI001AC92F54|nr:MBL fold metallo-hydrolase [Hyphomicrobiales bacterium]
MAKLTVISGVGGKLPAAFLLEIRGARLLFDLGEGPEAGVLPDLTKVGRVDAILLSHAHIDHVGGLGLRGTIGNPPVYATAEIWRQISETLVAPADRHVLPLRGAAVVAGIALTTGRSGHAPGGIWVHTAEAGGILYTGDWSVESTVFPFDPPPPAATVVTDASYGDRETTLESQIDDIAEAARDGAVLCVPAFGRGPEMALRLSALGLRPRLCPAIRAEVEHLAADRSGLAAPGATDASAALLATLADEPVTPDDVVIATEANAESGFAATLYARRDEGFRFLFSGHVPAGTPAARLIAAGEARWLPWNVHPRLADTLDLVDRLGARTVIAAFTAPASMPVLAGRLGDRLSWQANINLANSR